MAIVRVDPSDASKANIVQVDSDACDNTRAMREIEDWAAGHGFVRSNEYWLRSALTSEGRVFRGVCYRLQPDEVAATQQRIKDTDEAMARMPVTQHIQR